MYTIIGTPRTRTLRVLWLLEEMGLPYTHHPAAPHAPEVLSHNPAGKVPILLTGDVTITDSTAILTYLADHHAQFTAPPGTLARAQQDSLTQFLLDEIEGPLWMAARHSFVLPAEQRMPEIKSSLKWEYARSLTRLAARLQGPFLLGDAPTIPDIIATHCLLWAGLSKFPATEGLLADYQSRMTGRPALARAMARE